MRIREVDIPDVILDAQETGTLVIFAGAGVSIPSPSNLPSFDGLAKTIAGKIHRNDDEPLDSFFGRLSKEKIDIHNRVSSIIGNSVSKPNVLHKSIVSLFPTQKDLRIVTTNFDRHFSSVIDSSFNIESYFAPALPLGRSFSGLVYLHGSVDKDTNRLIISDSDFGRAYLNDGWATRFLCEMFSNFIVLFIGYSHKDPVMRYIARAIDRENTRFALTAPGEEKRWEFLGIKPIIYPQIAEHDHTALQTTLVEWSRLSRMGMIEKEKRIKELVSSGPPIDAEDSDYIYRIMRNPITAKLVLRYAKGPSWLSWIEKKGLLENLFQTDISLNDVECQLASWFAENFLESESDSAISVIQRKGLRLNPYLWGSIATVLTRKDVAPETRLKWMTLLLDNARYCKSISDLNIILSDCSYPNDVICGVWLFDYLTRPQVLLKPRLQLMSLPEDLGNKQYEVDIVFSGEYYWLKEAWDNFLRPNLKELVYRLEPIITINLTRAHHLLEGLDTAKGKWDPLSFRRSAIEPHEQDSYPQEIDILIDAARDTIDTIFAIEISHGLAIAKAWTLSKIPILERIAIHAVAHSCLDSDVKLQLLIENDWLYSYGKKHEVFVLLQNSFASASEPIKQKVLEKVEQGDPDWSGSDEEALERQAYERYNILIWLQRHNPSYTPITQLLNEIKTTYKQFSPREHPDLDHWTGPVEWVAPISPVSCEELLKENPVEKLEFLLNYDGDGWREPDRDGLLSAVREAVSKDFSWALGLVDSLQDVEAYKQDLWRAIISGWRDAVLTKDQWECIVVLLVRRIELLPECFSSVIDLLSDGIDKEEGKIPVRLLIIAEKITKIIYQEYIKNYMGTEDNTTTEDWLTLAINRIDGRVALFWIKSLSRRRKDILGFRSKFPSRYKSFFDQMIKESVTDLECVILASQAHFLFSVDEGWAKKSIIPLLDIENDASRAIKCWNGYLWWGRWQEPMLSHLMPLFLKLLSSDRLTDKMTEKLVRFLASIAVYSQTVHPIEDRWLIDFIELAGEYGRECFATSVGHLLREANKKTVSQVWSSWLREYLRLRGMNSPEKISEEERRSLFTWVPYLEPVLADTVDIYLTFEAPSFEFTTVYRDLNKLEVVNNPIPIAQILTHLLKGAKPPFRSFSDVVEIYKKLSSTQIPADYLRQLCEELIRLGYDQTDELIKSI